MARRSFTKKDRARIFNAHLGICHLCQGQIGVGEAWEVEHVIAYALTQDNSDDNLRPSHVKCHRAKTDRDVAAIAQAKRREAKHRGVAKPAGKIRSAPFPPASKPERTAKPALPFKTLFRNASRSAT
jgi:5-methylcytosine-specific restriction endonuclease McrA